jgi:hypothetical protein
MLMGSFLLSSCLLPGMIPLDSEATAPAESTDATEDPAQSAEQTGSRPVMEEDAEVMLEKLRGGEWVYLQELAEEQYTQEEYDRPGTRTFTVTITDDTPTYFNYGWCTTTEEILQQNFEHIQVRLSFNGEPLGTDVVHPITSTRSNGFVCLEFGVLMSDWPPGEYELEAMATFDEPINDGAADFEAGDYIHKYNVTVEE